MSRAEWMHMTIAVVFVSTLCGGCEKSMRNMYDQYKYKPLAQSALWADQRSGREPLSNTVVHSGGTFAGTSSGRLELRDVEPKVQALPLDDGGRVKGPVGQLTAVSVLRNPLPVTRDWLRRGQQRFDIYCAPCHGEAGEGDGMVVQRGFPAPPSYHIPRLRNAPDAHIYAVITDGYGAMYSYANRVTPKDRWAIVEYIRALQLSQNARFDDVPAGQRKQLETRQ